MVDENTDGRAGAPSEEEEAAPATPKRSRARAKAKPAAPAEPKPAAKRRTPKRPAAKPAPVKIAVAAEPPTPAAQPDEIAIAVRASAPPPAPESEDIPVRMGGGGPQLAEELHEIEVEVRNASQAGPASDPTGELAASLLRLVAENLRQLTTQQVGTVRALLDQLNLSDYFDPDFWRGIGIVLRYQIDEQAAFIKRRVRGEYSVDRYGLDREIVELARPFQSFMYRSWWRTSTEGAAQLPASGRALLVANHSGVIPWDAMQISTAVAEERADLGERLVRPLYMPELNNLPFVGQLLAALGQVPALPEHAEALLAADELVCVFPESSRGAGKPFRERYRLARFGRGGFVAAALRSGAPIVPVAVIGAEETYPMLANIEPLARLLRLPYFPVTPFFPWLGPLGLLPLPSRWKISFGAPVATAEYGPEAADDPLTVFMLSEQIRSTIQETIDEQLAGRGGVF